MVRREAETVQQYVNEKDVIQGGTLSRVISKAIPRKGIFKDRPSNITHSRSMFQTTVNETQQNISQFPQVNGVDMAALTRIERYAQDVDEMMRTQFLNNIWKFEDLHKEYGAPSFIHRLPKVDIKHINTVEGELLLTNNKDQNVDVYGIDSETVLKTLNI